ncbi:MAG: hypothetical protein ISQ28_00165 [Alphaproteobacteria bacterium]|nr:hypothetical protein [Alphaproteobacteria bacterium]
MAAQKKPVIQPASRFESITPALVIACIMTGAWFVAGWSLFGYYGGPSGFAALSPAEVGLVVCGGLLPLMVIWLLCGMMIVGTRMRNAMMTELSALRTVNIMPEETQSHIRSITRAFEDRVEHLQGVTSGILASLDRATGHYEYQSEVLETLSGRVHEQTTELSTTLQDQTEQVTVAEARIDRMVNRMKHAMDDVREAGEGFRSNLVAPIEEVQETLGKANSRINDQIDAIWSRLELLDAAQSETEEASIRTREVLEGESHNLREAAKEALGNVETMSGKLESQIGLLKSVSEDANGVADQMQNRLEEQSSALAKAGDDLAAHAEDLHRAIEAQVSHLGHLQSSVEGYGDVISREFEQKVETLMNAAREAADIVGEHTARATRQAIEELSENGDRLTGNIGVVSDRVEQLTESLNGGARRLQDTTLSVQATLKVSAQDVAATLIEATKAAEKRYVELGDAWAETLEDQAERVEALQDMATAAEDNAFAHAEESVVHLARRLDRALQDRFEDEDGAFNTAQRQIDAAGQRTVENYQRLVGSFVHDLTDTAGVEMERLVVWGQEIPRAAEHLRETAAEITHQMDEQTKSLLARTNEVRHATTDALVSAQALFKGIAEAPERLTATVASLGQASTAAVEDLREQTEALNGQLLDCRNRLASLTDGFNGGLDEGQIDARLQQLAEAINGAQTALVEAAAAFDATTQDASNVANQAAERLTNSTSLVADQVQTLRDITANPEGDTTLRRVADQADELRQILEQVGIAAENHQLTLVRVSEEAKTQSERLLQTVKQSERDAFLNQAASMVEALHQVAIDVDTILDGDLPSDVVQAIEAGDRGVSVRRLLKRYTPAGAGAGAMADLYARDRAFTEQVDRYLETFDSLLAQANQVDRSKLLHTTFLTADIGKLYVFLARSIGVMQAAE